MKTSFLCFILIASARFSNQLNAQINSDERVHQSTAVVFPSAMNVLYVGVDNPVQIAVPGASPGQITATGCGIKPSGGIDYIARPVKVGFDTITVSVKNGKTETTYQNVFRVRRIPDPYVYIGKIRAGRISVGEFKASDKLVVGNPDFIFQLPYKIISFEMVYAPKSGSVVSDVSTSNMFTKLMLDIVAKAKPGDIIVFQSVVVQMPGGENVTLNTSYKLTG